MPKGTRVEKCYTRLKKKYGPGRAAAMCQSSTKQSLHTGKSLGKRRRVSKSAKPRGY
jgi:hypothetical protein